MSKYTREVRMVSYKLAQLDDVHWVQDMNDTLEREIEWHADGYDYAIWQEGRVGFKEDIILFETRFYRDGALHFLGGPAILVDTPRLGRVENKWWVNHKQYSELEFNFFIKGMLEAEV